MKKREGLYNFCVFLRMVFGFYLMVCDGILMSSDGLGKNLNFWMFKTLDSFCLFGGSRPQIGFETIKIGPRKAGVLD